MQHFMFVNYGDDITVTITSSEPVGVFEMRTSGTDIERVVGIHTSSQWNLLVPRGAIYGFAVDGAVSFTNPDPEQLKVYTASSKNPWPPPPPPPPQFAAVSDYETRYASFLLALQARRPAPAAHAEGAAP